MEFVMWNEGTGDSDRFRTRVTKLPDELGEGGFGVYTRELKSKPTPVFESLEEARRHADAEIDRMGGPAVLAAWVAVVDYQTGHTWELPAGTPHREHKPGTHEQKRYALYWPKLGETAPSYPTVEDARARAREKLKELVRWTGTGWDVSDAWVAIVDWETGATEEHRVVG
jgi:hypothetical protein